jgi:hypothetical protein
MNAKKTKPHQLNCWRNRMPKRTTAFAMIMCITLSLTSCQSLPPSKFDAIVGKTISLPYSCHLQASDDGTLYLSGVRDLAMKHLKEFEAGTDLLVTRAFRLRLIHIDTTNPNLPSTEEVIMVRIKDGAFGGKDAICSAAVIESSLEAMGDRGKK